MIYDPYQTYQAGFIAASLVSAQRVLEDAFVYAVALNPDGKLAEAITKAQEATREASKINLWEQCRDEV